MATTFKFPDTEEGMLALLSTLDDEQLQEMFEAQQQLEAQLRIAGPQNDDELHAWIKSDMGIDIPRVAVCENHQAPFTFLADVYFERCEAALAVANRGGSKTFIVAVLHWLNSRFKPGCESCTFGAVEQQSFRAYSHLKGWIFDDRGDKIPEVVSTLQKETWFTNGSKIEVLGSTPEQVNGPHPQKSHADEIELMREDTWSESRNMTMSGRTKDGRVVSPQDISTSTRKGPSGRVQKLIDEITDAVREGFKPPRKLYMWCQKETSAERANCQEAPEAARRARLKELGKDPNSLCDCHLVRSGKYENGGNRLLTHICKGDFFKSRGWQPPADIIKQFTENDPETYAAQVLCQRPEMKFHYLPTFTEEHHGLLDYVPEPDNGPIFLSVDWGGTNPHAVNWYQLLNKDIDTPNFYGELARVREGTLVCFDEIYVAEIGNDELGRLVKDREKQHRLIFKETKQQNWTVFERYADPQGKAAKLDWKSLGLRTSWHATREKEEQFKAIRQLMSYDNFRVCVDKCPMWVEEAKDWRKDESTGYEIEHKNHCMSNFRYLVINVNRVKEKALALHHRTPKAKAIRRSGPVIVDTRQAQGPLAFRGRQSDNEFDRWRKSLGRPVNGG